MILLLLFIINQNGNRDINLLNNSLTFYVVWNAFDRLNLARELSYFFCDGRVCVDFDSYHSDAFDDRV